MAQQDIVQSIVADSSHSLDLFDEAEIAELNGRAFLRHVRGKEVPHVECIVRRKIVRLTPEEVVRQLYAARLIEKYGYQPDRIAFEYQVNFGLEKKKADIVVFDKDREETPYIVVEVKKPKLSEGKGQLRSYCNGTGAPIGVWTNGQQISHYNRKDPNYFEDISDIPNSVQSLADILNERFTQKDLIIKDRIANGRKSLKDIILEMEDEVLANAGVDVFEEAFKLIFTKLFDESLSRDDREFIKRTLTSASGGKVAKGCSKPREDRDYDAFKAAVGKVDDSDFRVMEFRNTGQTDTELKEKIEDLFRRAIDEWPGIFPEGTTFDLADSHLAVCVSSLQDVKLFNSNLLVVDEAFEYLVNKSAKGEKGQYFTPRHVIDMCVQMLNPRRGETMIDPASGSCGFPLHTIFKMTERLFTNEEILNEDREHVRNVFGIDFDEKTVRVARTLNMIAGAGETNVLHLNTLDFTRWDDKYDRDRKWISTYEGRFRRLEKLRSNRRENRQFDFDLVLANPPFAGDIKESRVLHQFEIARNGKGIKSVVGRDILFIERNLDFLKPGGRMAIVLPQGRFNNTTDRYIRDFISERARILAVVGLHPNSFKPHTGTKTSVLFLQKWNDDPGKGPFCPRMDDYPVFMAVSEKGGKDNSGNYIYLKSESGQYRLDNNGHMIVDHDLHAHGGALQPGIAEAFAEWAKREKLSFWSS